MQRHEATGLRVGAAGAAGADVKLGRDCGIDERAAGPLQGAAAADGGAAGVGVVAGDSQGAKAVFGQRKGRGTAIGDVAADGRIARAGDGEGLGRSRAAGAALHIARECQCIGRTVVGEGVGAGGGRAEEDAGIEEFVREHIGAHRDSAAVVERERLAADSPAADGVGRSSRGVELDRTDRDAAAEIDCGLTVTGVIENRRVAGAGRRGSVVPIIGVGPDGVTRATPCAHSRNRMSSAWPDCSRNQQTCSHVDG